MPRKKTLYDAYRFPGFTPGRVVKGRFGDRTALVIRLTRRSKKRHAVSAGPSAAVGTISGLAGCGTFPAEIAGSTWSWSFAGSIAGSAAQ